MTYYKPGTRTVIGSEPCGISYRKCTNPKMSHNFYKTATGRAGAVNFYASRSHSTANNSDDDDDTASTPSTTPMHACGIHDASAAWGDHSSTWLCNESPCSNRQVPYCLAMCPYTGTHGTATTPMHVCNIHELWRSGDHSWITPPCNDDTHCMYACQTNSDHSMSIASCSVTNSNGDSCTVTSFYACANHTHVYPTVPDRPGSFSLTPGYISIQLSWTSSASDGGSAITAYEYQYQSSTNGRLSWSSWSDWTSGGTDNFTLIQGLSRGTDYSVRMRAVNSVGTSRMTGQDIVRTRND